ncbi:MAG: Formamidopyrimidine-DNA glycosylase [Candidatus Azambacteria bacterium GW2011_GWB1_42_17]|uniref:Formamidopyrimidine-DNA glycosylase n=2 Tax=Candidatus Azamiibacteriota TaxID=1752741 RepID=A0A0G0Z9S0_9BACT|nr:MAG: Formamidopyrimidine-DNA glycosylase [Candidatus Azambacteria bacterium GW2011_GWB1_42_17]KKS45394.1 MAG: Formamidopyrimidine-DNA glycosylase [Candidatus Azambacteria bacterium GW2011_GWA1_42_19]KKS87944.1 MAG: Formamidopyrimidine-DNA glycosylase [Parcubacteria group bacterium GW2011_GWC1_43_11]
MPELPEVQTIVDDLNKKVKGLTIADIWTDWPKQFKRSPGGFDGFKKAVKGEKIMKVWRLGKNIIFDLSGGKKILIHQKMTGHLLVGRWQLKNNNWVASDKKGLLTEKVNGYIHVMFWLSNKNMLALSDLRKFAKVLVANERDFKNLEDVKNIGPDPLKPDFDFKKFKNLITKKRGVIKKVLMDQSIISGIGNIYADDILFTAKIHPLKKTESLGEKELKAIFEAIKKILKKAVKLRGTSTSDYRDTSGKKGGYGEVRLVYQREGEKCSRKCGGIIKRIKINSRSAHFCPICQKI